ncbi:helix-turn-helix transcriptional regulator [Paenibacillus tuaregi]|uniref:helix-turn-helix transcriptional regulator n=1 Tax=Paenibacillus tuaregi TaxID=1816681 RepID=UPI0008395D77|nr:YafY family protein [Paenibacillus tuaregi]
MNKTDRMLAIMLMLQSRGTLRAEDLASNFETSVRTIYRDMQALSEAGVPVVGAPGTGYSLMEGYFLPPVSFTADEAVALLIGTDFIIHNFEENYRDSAESSRMKIEAILPERVRTEADRVRGTTRLLMDAESWARSSRENPTLGLLRTAVIKGNKVRFNYVKAIPGPSGERFSSRTVSPYGLVLLRGRWMLIAYCELRQEIRHFRVSRMQDISMLEEQAVRPADFNLAAYSPPDDRELRVRIEADPELADQLREKGSYYVEQVTEREGRLIVDLRARHVNEILGWILSFGSRMRVLEPEAVRVKIRDELRQMAESY